MGATKTATRVAGQATKKATGAATGAARGATKTASSVSKKALEPVAPQGSTPFPTESPYSGTPTQTTPLPTKFPYSEPPTDAPPLDICTGTNDFECYKTGRPACCSDDEYTCPNFMTMCDNHPEAYTGTSYCTNAPEYGCDPATWSNSGWPKCCDAPGGDVMNCPIEQPTCHPEDEDTDDDTSTEDYLYLPQHLSASNFVARVFHHAMRAATGATAQQETKYLRASQVKDVTA